MTSSRLSPAGARSSLSTAATGCAGNHKAAARNDPAAATEQLDMMGYVITRRDA
jgi:hypothetical protein